MMRTLLLIDGEHYPPVIVAALPRLRGERFLPVGALFLGGYEKTGSPPEMPFPVHTGDPFTALPRLIEDLGIETVIDMSDEPILDPRIRFRLAGLALAAGASYVAGGMRLDPSPQLDAGAPRSVTIIGTGKRTGKTAVAIDLARHWKAQGLRPCIVTMGRGGPPEPVLVEAGEADEPGPLLRRLLAAGLHATSDYVEDAIFAGVDTVGTRRVGAGPAGVVVDGNFEEGLRAALDLRPDLLLCEGSGTAIPPVATDAVVLVTRSDLDAEFLAGYLGPYRLAIASVLVVIDCGDPGRIVEVAHSLRPELPCVLGSLAPEPTVPVAGRRVVLATTAPPGASGAIAAALVDQGAVSVETVASLSDRRRLGDDLTGLDDGTLVLTEVKAAAADVVIPVAEKVGAEVGFVHNTVVVDGGMQALIGPIEDLWTAAPQAMTS